MRREIERSSVTVEESAKKDLIARNAASQMSLAYWVLRRAVALVLFVSSFERAVAAWPRIPSNSAYPGSLGIGFCAQAFGERGLC